MLKKKDNHNWTKEKPHRADNGQITTRKYAEKNPRKVEWVKDKKNKKNK